jgi:hypothetical protein
VTAQITDAAALGCPKAKIFVREYGKSGRKFLNSLLSPFVPDPWDGRSIFAPSGNSAVRVLPKKSAETQREQRNRRLHKEWEQALGKFGLSEQQLNGCGEKQVVVVNSDQVPPLRTVDSDTQAATKFGLTWRSAHSVPIQTVPREIPEAFNSDDTVRRFLLHLFPSLAGNPRGPAYAETADRARRRAAITCYVLVRYFREMALTREVAEGCGISEESVENQVHRLRVHMESFASGRPTKKCCKRKRRKNK